MIDRFALSEAKPLSDYYTQNREEILSFLPATTKRLLDIGCGTGAFGATVKNNFGAEVWGIEVVEEMAHVAEKKIDKVLVGDVCRIAKDIPDRYFDCITCNDVLEHLIDPYSLLSSLGSKIVETGVIICSIPNVRYWNNLKDFVVGKQWRYSDSGILDRTHLRFFTELSIRDMFSSLKFEIIRMEGINESHARSMKLYNFLTFGALEDTKYLQFVCVVRPSNSL